MHIFRRTEARAWSPLHGNLKCYPEEYNRDQTLPKVKSLNYADIHKAVKTMNDAFQDDILQKYIFETPDSKKTSLFEKMAKRTLAAIDIALDKDRGKYVLTVSRGDALLLGEPAPNNFSKTPSPINRLVEQLSRCIKKRLKLNQLSPQQLQRLEEVKRAESELNALFGKYIDDMIYVEGLATAPASQGRGYGSALLSTIKSIAAEQGCDVYLHCHNLNVPFYELNGFIEYDKRYIGCVDPNYKGPLVSLHVMVAYAKS